MERIGFRRSKGLSKNAFFFLRRSDSAWELVDLLECSFRRIVPFEPQARLFRQALVRKARRSYYRLIKAREKQPPRKEYGKY